ncbi:hypothetical protein HDZ31DRAFT_75156 [Schizophyllum fasciatum]
MAPNAVEDLWFPDGNVIIRAGDRLCRVYKGFLASQSTVLADMFSIPQPDAMETYDGIPVLMLPDPAEEVLHWLKSMLFPKYFETYPERIPFPKLLAVLRLSHKYDVQYLRQRALYSLSTELPVSLADTLPLFGDNLRSTIDMGGRAPDNKLDFLLSAYPIVLEIGAVWLFPALMYRLHICGSSPYMVDDKKASQIATVLSPQDVWRVWKVACAVVRAFPASMVAMWATGRQCTNRGCYGLEDDRLDAAYEELLQDPFRFLGPADQITGDFHYGGDTLICNLCHDCYGAVRDTYRESCERLWQSLPNVLDLPDWQELRTMRDRDINGQTSGA